MLTRALAITFVLAAAGAAAQEASPLLGLLGEAPEPAAPAVRIDGRTMTLAEGAAAAERLDDDVLVLSRITALQQRLLEVNAVRAAAGAEPFLLPRRICTASPLAGMCDALPLTFAPATGDQP